MRPPRLPRTAYRGALAVCVLAVAWLAFAPLAEPPLLSWDKSNHLLAFGVMAWLADAGWPERRLAAVRWGLLLGYGVLIELVQSALPTRHFSLLDIVADAAGILLYLGLRRLLAGARGGAGEA
jgi:VanZ family protein